MITDSNFLQIGIYSSTLNKAQCEILDIPYPLIDGWEILALGKELSEQEVNLFILLRGKLSLRSQDQMFINYNCLSKFIKRNKEENELKTKKIQKVLRIYCDGACQGNPGKSGSGLAVYYDNDAPTLMYGEFQEYGTNNTAELNALYKAILIASESQYPKNRIYCDSTYSINCITKWAYGWQTRGWTKKGGEIKNLELIQIIHALYHKIKDTTTIKYVKAHSGNEGNELADRMAVMSISLHSKGKYQKYEYENVKDVLKL